jgi:hypothetical protein
MGDGPGEATRDNRWSRNPAHRVWEVTEMLEWRPRLIALLALVVLIAVTIGYAFPLADNWEW